MNRAVKESGIPVGVPFDLPAAALRYPRSAPNGAGRARNREGAIAVSSNPTPRLLAAPEVSS